jgi:hypothetical protein
LTFNGLHIVIVPEDIILLIKADEMGGSFKMSGVEEKYTILVDFVRV